MLGNDMDTRSYAELLLAVGTQRSVGAYGVGFSLGRPFLEERIDRMTARFTGPRRMSNTLMVLGVFGVLCAAWALPQPVRAASLSHEWQSCPSDTFEANRALLNTVDSET
jgi:hypothetical protein